MSDDRTVNVGTQRSAPPAVVDPAARAQRRPYPRTHDNKVSGDRFGGVKNLGSLHGRRRELTGQRRRLNVTGFAIQAEGGNVTVVEVAGAVMTARLVTVSYRAHPPDEHPREQ